MLCCAVIVSGRIRAIAASCWVPAPAPVSEPVIAMLAVAVKVAGSARGVGDTEAFAAPVSEPVMVMAVVLVFTTPVGGTGVADRTPAFAIASAAMHERDAIIKRCIRTCNAAAATFVPRIGKLPAFDE
jgi:hypothetical protein